MAQFSENQILMALKVYQRSNPIPLDASSVWDSQSEAETYANAANAYAGQIITVKMEDETYKAFILQPGTSGYTLSELEGSSSSVKQVDTSENPLPSTDYTAGQMWRVAEAGTYAGNTCEIGDLIICLKDYDASSASDSDFMVVQANIDGAVTGADSSTDGHIVVFNGATGKVIKDSSVSIDSLNDAISKAHTHSNQTQLDSFTLTQAEILSAASTDAASQIATAKSELETSIASKADASNVYTKTDIDSQLSTITDNLNTKVDSTTVDSKIETAKTEILASAAESASQALEDRIGNIGTDITMKEYIDIKITQLIQQYLT